MEAIQVQIGNTCRFRVVCWPLTILDLAQGLGTFSGVTAGTMALLFACGLWSLVFPGFFVLFLTTGVAFGSLYPTKPISTTVLAAGRPAQVKWVEDGHPPLLGDLGHMKIHLLAGNSVCIACGPMF